MQTFLPHPNFKVSAAQLDPQRLRKQRAEVIQLLEALDDRTNKHHNHPACRMWRGFRDALVAYGLAICDEIAERGEQDNSRNKILAHRTVGYEPTQENVPMPRWIGNEAFHSSHRGNLLRKAPEWYFMFRWTDSPLLPYIWPVNYDPRLFHEPRRY
jgi:mRNA-degrading endonuclease YafQ of YafQ-DinJ toxin-antitoxin module